MLNVVNIDNTDFTIPHPIKTGITGLKHPAIVSTTLETMFFFFVLFSTIVSSDKLTIFINSSNTPSTFAPMTTCN